MIVVVDEQRCRRPDIPFRVYANVDVDACAMMCSRRRGEFYNKNHTNTPESLHENSTKDTRTLRASVSAWKPFEKYESFLRVINASAYSHRVALKHAHHHPVAVASVCPARPLLETFVIISRNPDATSEPGRVAEKGFDKAEVKKEKKKEPGIRKKAE